MFLVVWGRTNRGSHPRGSNYCVCDGECTHTHLSLAHFSGVHTLCVNFAHSHALTHMHRSKVSATFSFSCFTRLCSCCSLTVISRPFPTSTTPVTFSVHAILPNFPDLEAQVKRTPHEDEELAYLAKFFLPTTG